MADYTYVHHDTGAIVLESRDTSTRVKLNTITRFLYGKGASGNQVFNCGSGAFIKFQTKPEINKERALLTTKIYRHCIKHNININSKTFPSKKVQNGDKIDFNDFLKYINERKEC